MAGYYLSRSFGGKQHLFALIEFVDGNGSKRETFMPLCSCPGSNRGTMRATDVREFDPMQDAANVCKHGEKIIQSIRDKAAA